MFYGFVSQFGCECRRRCRVSSIITVPSWNFQPSTFVYNSKLDQYITTHNKMWCFSCSRTMGVTYKTMKTKLGCFICINVHEVSRNSRNLKLSNCVNVVLDQNAQGIQSFMPYLTGANNRFGQNEPSP